MQMIGDVNLLSQYSGYGNLLAHLRNLPEMLELYSGYCFEKGSRGRGNGQASSPLAGSNIWLADEDECVIICQAERGRGALVIRVYTLNHGSKCLSQRIWQIIHQHNLPYAITGSP
ncbi:MAG: hypothetical protein WC773_03570 [Patescibacteria group bacterium]